VGREKYQLKLNWRSTVVSSNSAWRGNGGLTELKFYHLVAVDRKTAVDLTSSTKSWHENAPRKLLTSVETADNKSRLLKQKKREIYRLPKEPPFWTSLLFPTLACSFPRSLAFFSSLLALVRLTRSHALWLFDTLRFKDGNSWDWLNQGQFGHWKWVSWAPNSSSNEVFGWKSVIC
jgi:hypothetical protein